MDETSQPHFSPNHVSPNRNKPPAGNGKVFIIVAGILALLAIALSVTGVYLGLRSGKITHKTDSTSKAEPLTDSFQEILNENCQEVSYEGGKKHQIALADLPITLDTKQIPLAPEEKNAFTCLFFVPDLPNQNYVVLRLVTHEAINLYDSHSTELGHGGHPYLGSAGTVISEKNGIKLSVFLSRNEGPGLVGKVPVRIRGEKRLALSNGDAAFVNYETTAIDSRNSRLIEFLNDHATPSDEIEPGSKQITGDAVDELLKEKFFTTVTEGSFENEAIRQVLLILNAINPI